MFILILNVFFKTHFLKMAPIRVRLSPGFPPGAGFPGEEFAPACLSNSGVLLAPRWSREEPGFPHVVSSDEIAPREILLQSWYTPLKIQ
jgi:hypothetical protein